MEIQKTLCPIHRYMYSGSVCPFCQQDKLSRLSHRHYREEEKPEEVKEITLDDLENLKKHFNNK